MGGLQGAKDLDQSAIGIPGIEQTPDGLPWTEFRGQIAPGRAGAKHPKNAVEYHAPIARRSSGRFGLGKEILDAVPGVIRKSIAGHGIAFLDNGLH